MSKVYLVSYCAKSDIELLKKELSPQDTLVGVDQGAFTLFREGLMPAYIIGDFDSLIMQEAQLPNHIQLIKLRPDKDESDLEYAVNYFLSHQPDSDIIIINNLQGRFDHILLTLFLLEKRDRMSILSAHQQIFLLESKSDFNLSLPIDTCLSLIPISEEVAGITTKGLLYKLNNETMYRNKSRGLSNITIDKNIEIFFKTGKLLVVINF